MNRKVTISLQTLTITLLAVVFAVGDTYAGFSTTDVVTQGIGAAGKMKTSIFLNYNIWNVLETEVYYMQVIAGPNDSHSAFILPTRTVTVEVHHSNGETSATLKMAVFEYDVDTVFSSENNTYSYYKYLFYRCNPDGLTSENVVSKKWNQTDDIVYSASTNYICIIDWNGSPNNNSGYTTNEIYLSNNELWFRNA